MEWRKRLAGFMGSGWEDRINLIWVCMQIRPCHSERSEESRFLAGMGKKSRFFVTSSLRLTFKNDFAYTL